MEKYFELKIRMANEVLETPNGEELEDVFYYGEGKLRIKDNQIYGVIALDYLEGIIGKERIKFVLYMVNVPEGPDELEFDIPIDEFEIPESYIFNFEDEFGEMVLEMTISNMIVDQDKKEFQELLEDTVKFYEYFEEHFHMFCWGILYVIDDL